MTSDAAPHRDATLLDYLRLFRLPNVFTAFADVAMGFFFVQGTHQPVGVLGGLLAASGLIYTAGMVLNDVFDCAVDAVERPARPLPAGRIPLGRARAIGFGMLLAGVAAAWIAGFLQPVDGAMPWRSGAIGSLLAVCVVLYNAGLKRTPFSPIAMGSCRLLNVLLGMSIAAPFTGEWNLLGFGPQHLVPAGGIGLYVAGITLFAKGEAAFSRRGLLIAGLLMQVAGIAVLGLLPLAIPPGVRLMIASESSWFLLLGVLALTIARRAVVAIADPAPHPVQMSVKHSILSLIVLDAAVVMAVGHWQHAIGVLALLIPTVILGRWVYST